MTCVSASFASRLASSLTGLDLDPPARDVPSLLGWLREQGIDAGEIARSRRDAGQEWPFPVPAEWPREAGFARWSAAIDEAHRLLGVDLTFLPPSNRTSLTADERRLLADVPPHHGV